MNANLNGQSPSQHPRTGLLPMDGWTRFGLGVLVAADSPSMHEDPARAWGDKHGAQRPRQPPASRDAAATPTATASEGICRRACTCRCHSQPPSEYQIHHDRDDCHQRHRERLEGRRQ